MLSKSLGLKSLALALGALGAASAAGALQALPALEYIRQDDQEALEALALQPPVVLEAILAASPYPGGIARIQGSQSAAARSFEVLLEDRTPGSRVVLWTLARHPELIRDLVASGQKPAWQREHMASSYAEEVREAAIACEGECHDALVRVDALHAEATAAFEQVIEDYPAAIQEAFRTLLAAPGVFDILIDHMRLTLALAEAQERDPESAAAAFAELHQRVAERAGSEGLDGEAKMGAVLATTPESEPEPVSTTVVVQVSPDRYPSAYSYPYPYPYPYWAGYTGFGRGYPYAYSHYAGAPLGFSFGFGLGHLHTLVLGASHRHQHRSVHHPPRRRHRRHPIRPHHLRRHRTHSAHSHPGHDRRPVRRRNRHAESDPPTSVAILRPVGNERPVRTSPDVRSRRVPARDRRGETVAIPIAGEPAKPSPAVRGQHRKGRKHARVARGGRGKHRAHVSQPAGSSGKSHARLLHRDKRFGARHASLGNDGPRRSRSGSRHGHRRR